MAKQPETTALLIRAGALLLDAAGMLRMEADEWRGRKSSPPKNWTAHADAASWADKCERIAETDERAAKAMLEHARKIGEAVNAKEPA